MPAHAHLNLLGWVCLFLFGIFYHLHPAIDRSRTAMVQVVWIVATIILAIGVGLVHTGHPVGDQIAAAASLVVFADICCSARLVLLPERFAVLRAHVRRTGRVTELRPRAFVASSAAARCQRPC